MTHYQRRRAKKASERGRRMANARWAQDRERRARLAEQERRRRERLVLIVRDTGTGEERLFPWGPYALASARLFAESTEW